MEIRRVAIIGAGTMGRGIAQWFAQQEVQVFLVDLNNELLAKSISDIHESWNKLLSKNKFTSFQIDNFKNHLNSSDLDNLSDLDLVIEAIVEKESIKLGLFQKLDQLCPPHTIMASNTSSLSIKKLSHGVQASRRDKFLGLHFFNPATLMKLVEIVETPELSPSLAKDLAKWFEARGKVPAICHDGPGFIVNRLARSFYGESLRIVGEENLEKEKEVDNVLKAVGGFQMGPFELMDLIGIDINLDVTNIVWNAFHKNPRFAPHPLQEKMVRENRLGKKSKHGFYKYE
ncbi:MAG: hypothetical protein Fur0010_14000 [Bdellovibrio sp.]